MSKLKLTPAERSWILYDVGNSAAEEPLYGRTFDPRPEQGEPA